MSVIIATYNRADLIGRAIESVLSQSYADLELLIVDDGSTDGTRGVVAGYNDPRLVYIWQENSERAAARNAGLRASRGRYIAFLDSDDWYLPSKLALQVSALEARPLVGFVIGGWDIVDPQEALIVKRRPWDAIPGQPTLEDWLFSVTACTPSILLRTEALKAVGGYDVSMPPTEDTDLLVRLHLAGITSAWTPEAVAVVLWHAHNSLRQLSRVRESRLALMRKVLACDDAVSRLTFPPSVALARQYLALAALAYASGLAEGAQADLMQAVQLDPDLVANGGERLVAALVDQTGSHLIETPLHYLDFAFEHLPEELLWLRRSRHKARGRFWAKQAFQASQSNDWSKVRVAASAAARHDATWLGNRGFVSTWLRSLAGGRRWWRHT